MTLLELYKARIQSGDDVTIITNEGGIVECMQAVTVIQLPQGPGDLWQFQRSDGSVFALNPYHRDLIRIEKAPRNQQ
jgi:hypothetical protein